MTGGRAAGVGCLVLGGGLVACGVAVVVFVSAIGGLLPQQMTTQPTMCRAGAGQGGDQLSRDQWRNAKTIASVGKEMGVPPQGWALAIAGALQESGLLNIDYGDRDSLGLFQQRPSAGWGTPSQILDPGYAARQFFSHLTDVSGWKRMRPTLAIQAVQRSAFPYAYAAHMDLARHLVSKITDGGFTCAGVGAEGKGRGPDGHWLPEEMGPDGLTPRTRHVMELVEKKWNEHDIGGYCPGGCITGHVSGSDHYDGHAVDVMILPWHDPQRVAKGKRVVHWLIANAKPLAIKYIIYRKRIWEPDEGWQPYTHPSGVTGNPTLNHMDHIHVSVY